LQGWFRSLIPGHGTVTLHAGPIKPGSQKHSSNIQVPEEGVKDEWRKTRETRARKGERSFT
jgi:hypothetical protein